MRAGLPLPLQGLGTFLELVHAYARAYERLLEAIVLLLMASLTLLIVAGAAFRYLGDALSWYDELASIGLVWLTYYGSALAALRGAHIGVPGLVNAMPPKAARLPRRCSPKRWSFCFSSCSRSTASRCW